MTDDGMIVLKQPLPLVRGPGGDAVTLRPEWLRIAIRTAAQRAGYNGFWQLDDLVTGISLYLGHCYRRPVIELLTLENMVRLALCKTGFHKVADQLNGLTPSQNISLVQLVETSHTDNHENFFETLAEVIARLDRSGVQHFSFHDLQACVESLPDRSLPIDATKCGKLKQKIVDFVRSQVQRREWNQDVWCSIA